MQTKGGEYVEGFVDWSEQVLVVYGSAAAPEHISNPVQKRLMGFRGAKVVAFRNLLEMVGQVQVDSETRVQNFMVENDSISTRVQGLVRGARVRTDSQSQSKDGAYRLALELPLRGAFSSVILPAAPSPNMSVSYALPNPTPYAPVSNDSLSGDVLADTPLDAPPAVYVPPKTYTGLIVDARGLDLQPSMSPRIVARDGRIIYSAASSDSNYVAEYGLVGYGKDRDQAMRSDRIGGENANPFVVKAADVTGLYKSDIILEIFDATLVVMADIDGDFLRECRVHILLGPRPVVIDSAFIDSLYIDATHRDSLSEESTVELSEQAAPSDAAE
ncbi:MAG: hypothetical protein VXY00_08255 [Candidatus Latescibacterota bacterium]|nr:hypothetical protein [Candidatus Latescibacterota bacterium]